MSTIYRAASRSTEITELKAEAIYRIGMNQVILRSQVGVNHPLLVNKVDGLCCLRTPFKPQREVDCMIMLINIFLQVTITGFSEKQPAWIRRRANEPLEIINIVNKRDILLLTE